MIHYDPSQYKIIIIIVYVIIIGFIANINKYIKNLSLYKGYFDIFNIESINFIIRS